MFVWTIRDIIALVALAIVGVVVGVFLICSVVSAVGNRIQNKVWRRTKKKGKDDEIENCPYCNREPVYDKTPNHNYLYCPACKIGVKSGALYERKDTIDDWNNLVNMIKKGQSDETD